MATLRVRTAFSLHARVRGEAESAVRLAARPPSIRLRSSLSLVMLTSRNLSRADARTIFLSCPRRAVRRPSPSLRQILRKAKSWSPDRFKCRTRTSWWRVPNIHIPHVFLPCMIGRHPVASVNSAGASYTNTLHGLRPRRASDAMAVVLGRIHPLAAQHGTSGSNVRWRHSEAGTLKSNG